MISKGIKHLLESKKGTLSLIVFFCSLLPMTALCCFGRLDSTAYAACMSAITVAVTAIYCHTTSQTEQAAMMQYYPQPNPLGFVPQPNFGGDATPPPPPPPQVQP